MSYKWPDLSVTGEGIDPEIEEGSWEPLRDRIYAARPLESMDQEKRDRLEVQGWKVGSAEELLELTPEEAADIDLRLKISDAERETRKKT
jgi:hypothetical protein